MDLVGENSCRLEIFAVAVLTCWGRAMRAELRNIRRCCLLCAFPECPWEMNFKFVVLNAGALFDLWFEPFFLTFINESVTPNKPGYLIWNCLSVVCFGNQIYFNSHVNIKRGIVKERLRRMSVQGQANKMWRNIFKQASGSAHMFKHRYLPLSVAQQYCISFPNCNTITIILSLHY